MPAKLSYQPRVIEQLWVTRLLLNHIDLKALLISDNGKAAVAWLHAGYQNTAIPTDDATQLQRYLQAQLSALETVADPEAIGGPLYSNLYLLNWLAPICTLERNFLVFAALATQSPLLKFYLDLAAATTASSAVKMLCTVLDEPENLVMPLLSTDSWLVRAGFLRFNWSGEGGLLQQLYINRALLSRICNEPFPFEQNLTSKLFYLERVPTVVIKRSPALTMAAWLLKVQFNSSFENRQFGTQLVLQSPAKVPIVPLVTFSLEKLGLEVVNLQWPLLAANCHHLPYMILKLCQILALLSRKHQALLISGAANLLSMLEAPEHSALFERLQSTLRGVSYPLIWLLEDTIAPPKLLQRIGVSWFSFNPLACIPSSETKNYDL